MNPTLTFFVCFLAMLFGGFLVWVVAWVCGKVRDRRKTLKAQENIVRETSERLNRFFYSSPDIKADLLLLCWIRESLGWGSKSLKAEISRLIVFGRTRLFERTSHPFYKQEYGENLPSIKLQHV